MSDDRNNNVLPGLMGVGPDGKEYAIMMEIAGVESLDDNDTGPDVYKPSSNKQ